MMIIRRFRTGQPPTMVVVWKSLDDGWTQLDNKKEGLSYTYYNNNSGKGHTKFSIHWGVTRLV